jgi:hypothetical protein
MPTAWSRSIAAIVSTVKRFLSSTISPRSGRSLSGNERLVITSGVLSSASLVSRKRLDKTESGHHAFGHHGKTD